MLQSPESKSPNISQKNDMLRFKPTFKEEDQKEENLHSCHSYKSEQGRFISKQGSTFLISPKLPKQRSGSGAIDSVH